MEDLIKKVELYIEKDNLLSKSRERQIVYRRHYLYYILRKYGMKTTVIGEMFKKNHATVIHGSKTYKNLKKTKDKYMLNCLKEYLIEFENYDIEELEFSIIYDIDNATSWADIYQIRKRIEKNLYLEFK